MTHPPNKEDALIFREIGDASAPPLIYLPGVHGDWTPQAAARPMLSANFRLVELTYPKQPTWNVGYYVAALQQLMDGLDIKSAHLVAESFGSVIAWQFGLELPKRIRSLILVGGFCQPPGNRRLSIGRLGLSLLPTPLFEAGVDRYVSMRERQGRLKPEDGSAAYSSVRSDIGRRATVRRLELIQSRDYQSNLHAISFPVRYIGGERDVTVPVRREIQTLENSLPQEADFKSRVIPKGPHMIISSHPDETAGQIIAWAQESENAYQKRVRKPLD